MVLQEISEDWFRVLTRPSEATFTLLTQCPVKKWHFDKSESKCYVVWADNNGRNPSTKVQFFQHSSRSRLEAREWRQKFSISSRSMRPKGRNSRSRLETWDWREEILDLVSKHETERKKFSISSRELKLASRYALVPSFICIINMPSPQNPK